MSKGKVYKINEMEITRGNSKLGMDTLILNMGSAESCPSMKKGLCKIGAKCYARKAEIMYPRVSPFRNRQAAYWLNHTAAEIIDDLSELLEKRRTRENGKLVPLYRSIRYLRINEAGDFWSQECIEKLDTIAEWLLSNYQIETYTYSARSDLSWNQPLNFTVKGSGHDLCPHGKTIARPEKKLKGKTYQENGFKFYVCPMDCRDCSLCKRGYRNVVFPLH